MKTGHTAVQSELVKPVVAPMRPAGQSVQDELPGEALNFPMAQLVQLELCADEKEPAGQSVHDDDPKDEEKRPGEHEVQLTSLAFDIHSSFFIPLIHHSIVLLQ